MEAPGAWRPSHPGLLELLVGIEVPFQWVHSVPVRKVSCPARPSLQDFRGMDSNSCPPDPKETAEAFVMNRMDPSEKSVYEEHIAHCQACAMVVEETREFVQAIRDASSELGDEGHEKPK
jgi:hypothetical protein